MHDTHRGEIERIHEAYERRKARNYGDRYSYFNSGNLFLIHEREKRMLARLRREGFYPLDKHSIMEVGCGSGFWLRQFVQWGADPERLYGVELDRARSEEARYRCPSGVRIFQGDATQLNTEDQAFDIVFQSTVFSSILNKNSQRLLANEMLRIVRATGIILWYDFRFDNPRNPDVRGVSIRDLRELFDSCDIKVESLTLAPIIARTIARYSFLSCHFLSLMPCLRTHLLATIRHRRS